LRFGTQPSSLIRLLHSKNPAGPVYARDPSDEKVLEDTAAQSHRGGDRKRHAETAGSIHEDAGGRGCDDAGGIRTHIPHADRSDGCRGSSIVRIADAASAEQPTPIIYPRRHRWDRDSAQRSPGLLPLDAPFDFPGQGREASSSVEKPHLEIVG
jgi:hypothetical protein